MYTWRNLNINSKFHFNYIHKVVLYYELLTNFFEIFFKKKPKKEMIKSKEDKKKWKGKTLPLNQSFAIITCKA